MAAFGFTLGFHGCDKESLSESLCEGAIPSTKQR